MPSQVESRILNITVIGCGVSGLSCAIRLLEAGHRVAPRVVVVRRCLVGRVAVVGEDARPHRPVGAQAPDGRQRHDPVDAGTEQRGDVGTVVDAVRGRPRVEPVALEHERAVDVEHRDAAVHDPATRAREGAVAQRRTRDHPETHARTVRGGQPEASAFQSAG